MATDALHVPRNVIRNSNYIGRSNWVENPNADAVLDEFSIYNRSLSATEIYAQFNQNMVYLAYLS